ncbi:adenylate/guanylate cyclase domain-containing protein [Reichenbachiella versicolor]|uniref:adenylate/guanylate cyclase domain-containing protein n=1 Tax=Reichenbachiella versicolor TaxID=1821036 RepID=UPI000D6E37FE|nr:adenylate/guanylate cyclase domain-containing protein [Reichenbachiella versicolor]
MLNRLIVLQQRVVEFLKKYPKQLDALILIIWFVIGSNFFMFFKVAGFSQSCLDSWYNDLGFHFGLPTLAGLLIGGCTLFFEFNSSRFIQYRRLTQLFLRLIIGSITVTLCILIVHFGALIFINDLCLIEATLTTQKFIKTDIFFSIFAYLMFLGFVLQFFREMGNRFGHGIIINYMIGTYQQPTVVERTVMFIDLNHSTTISEELGHIKYSRLINKCFHLLSEVMVNYDAEIYQYVGDEVVLTWDNSRLKHKSNPVRLFYAFEKKILGEKEEFLQKFKVLPTFKASINTGSVVMSEVGSTGHKEIAYHGDVLNTCSRLLELSKKYQQPLLCTSDFFTELNDEKVISQLLDKVRLRGKSEDVSVYGLKLKY